MKTSVAVEDNCVNCYLKGLLSKGAEKMKCLVEVEAANLSANALLAFWHVANYGAAD